MKKLCLFFLLFACFGLESCKKNQSQEDVDAAKVPTEKPISVSCYKSLYEKDTIELKINTLSKGRVNGDMVMKILDMPKKFGKIIGEFRGDTLFVDYTFFQGTNEKKIFKNPMAFLKQGDELVLGNGKIETYLGVSYFVKGKPIDFDRVKYKFKSVDCSDK
jgi:hypothetical protein